MADDLVHIIQIVNGSRIAPFKYINNIIYKVQSIILSTLTCVDVRIQSGRIQSATKHSLLVAIFYLNLKANMNLLVCICRFLYSLKPTTAYINTNIIIKIHAYPLASIISYKYKMFRQICYLIRKQKHFDTLQYKLSLGKI